MPRATPTSTIVVTGDLTADWHIALARGADGVQDALWSAADDVSVFGRPGGAALLADVARALVRSSQSRGGKRWRVASPAFNLARLSPRSPGLAHSFATWSLFPVDKPTAWRVKEPLGLDRPNDGVATPPSSKQVTDDDPRPDLLVLDDAGLGFRQAESVWPAALGKTGRPGQIILKMAHPVAEGPLWDHLIGRFADRLTVIVSVADLRPRPVTISRGVAWELTASDVVRELSTNPAISGLTAARNLIVSFGPEGALVGRENDGGREFELVFDPEGVEGEWARDHPGGMVGYTSCLAGAAIRGVLQGDALADSATSGLAAMRAIHARGYGGVAGVTSVGAADLRFPSGEVVAALETSPTTFGRCSVPAWNDRRFAGSARWSIARERIGGRVARVAEDVALNGIAALEGIPRARFGKYTAVDLDETVALRSLSVVMREYWDQRRPEPLAIAVFGAPGAGKSFAVKQLAKAVFPGENVTTDAFNLTQLAGPAALVDAFHQVRDRVLRGELPLVFWDEFDASLAGVDLGWLRYFLAPMEDGTFQDGQITHPIGRAIFVFAGGRAASVDEFGGLLKPDEARGAKVPDFLSRLKGHLGVMGPNPVPNGVDSFYPIRRALLLRSMLLDKAPRLGRPDGSLGIDSGVLRAFLRIPYAHGARSMGAVIAMSRLANRRDFVRSSVPSSAQLGLHVDGEEFARLMDEPELAPPDVEALARRLHERFRAELKAKGYRSGPVTDERLKTHSSMIAFDDLPPHEQEQNRDSARTIPATLAWAGYAVVPRSAAVGGPLSKQGIERAAEREHARWVRMKIEQGWRHAAKTDKGARLHQDMLPWTKPPTVKAWEELYGPGSPTVMGRAVLSAVAKGKDRLVVRAFRDLLAKVGLVIVAR